MVPSDQETCRPLASQQDGAVLSFIPELRCGAGATPATPAAPAAPECPSGDEATTSRASTRTVCAAWVSQMHDGIAASFNRRLFGGAYCPTCSAPRQRQRRRRRWKPPLHLVPPSGYLLRHIMPLTTFPQRHSSRGNAVLLAAPPRRLGCPPQFPVSLMPPQEAVLAACEIEVEDRPEEQWSEEGVAGTPYRQLPGLQVGS